MRRISMLVERMSRAEGVRWHYLPVPYDRERYRYWWRHRWYRKLIGRETVEFVGSAILYW
jgi:hypothetical protein